MAAGDAPDITFDHWFRRNLEGGNWWVSLNEFLDMPNPYVAEGVPGHERWLDSLYDVGMSISRAPDGHHYQVSLDWVESAMFYNVAMFEEAGVEADWDELVWVHCRYASHSGYPRCGPRSGHFSLVLAGPTGTGQIVSF